MGASLSEQCLPYSVKVMHVASSGNCHCLTNCFMCKFLMGQLAQVVMMPRVIYQLYEAGSMAE